MIYYRSEYRINKNNCECYRNECAGKVGEKLDKLIADHPRETYTVQRREVRLDDHGVTLRDWKGRPQWGPWQTIDRIN